MSDLADDPFFDIMNPSTAASPSEAEGKSKKAKKEKKKKKEKDVSSGSTVDLDQLDLLGFKPSPSSSTATTATAAPTRQGNMDDQLAAEAEIALTVHDPTEKHKLDKFFDDEEAGGDELFGASVSPSSKAKFDKQSMKPTPITSESHSNNNTKVKFEKLDINPHEDDDDDEDDGHHDFDMEEPDFDEETGRKRRGMEMDSGSISGSNPHFQYKHLIYVILILVIGALAWQMFPTGTDTVTKSGGSDNSISTDDLGGLKSSNEADPLLNSNGTSSDSSQYPDDDSAMTGIPNDVDPNSGSNSNSNPDNGGSTSNPNDGETNTNTNNPTDTNTTPADTTTNPSSGDTHTTPSGPASTDTSTPVTSGTEVSSKLNMHYIHSTVADPLKEMALLVGRTEKAYLELSKSAPILFSQTSDATLKTCADLAAFELWLEGQNSTTHKALSIELTEEDGSALASNFTSSASGEAPTDAASASHTTVEIGAPHGIDHSTTRYRLNPFTLHRLHIRRTVRVPVGNKAYDAGVSTKEEIEASHCEGDSFHVWVRRLPDSLSELQSQLDRKGMTSASSEIPVSLLPDADIGSSTSGPLRSIRLDTFPWNTTEAMTFAHEMYRQPYLHHKQKALDPALEQKAADTNLKAKEEEIEIVNDRSSYFPVLMETVRDLHHRTEYVGAFFVAEPGLYRIDLTWLGTCYSDYVDAQYLYSKPPPAPVEGEESYPGPAAQQHIECSHLRKPFEARPVPGLHGNQHPIQPLYVEVDKGTGPLAYRSPESAPTFQESQELQDIQPLTNAETKQSPSEITELRPNCFHGHHFGYFIGTEWRSFDCVFTNYDLAKLDPVHSLTYDDDILVTGNGSPTLFSADTCPYIHQQLAEHSDRGNVYAEDEPYLNMNADGDLSADPSASSTSSPIAASTPNKPRLHPFWILLVGDRVMQGIFFDLVDLLLGGGEHLRDGFFFEKDGIQLEFKFWYETKDLLHPAADGKRTPFPLFGNRPHPTNLSSVVDLYQYTQKHLGHLHFNGTTSLLHRHDPNSPTHSTDHPAEEHAKNKLPDEVQFHTEGEPLVYPDVVVFSSMAYDIFHYPMSVYLNEFNRTLTELSNWAANIGAVQGMLEEELSKIHMKHRIVEDPFHDAGVTIELPHLSMPRLIFVKPQADFQWIRQETLADTQRNPDKYPNYKRLGQDCDGDTYSRSLLASHSASELVSRAAGGSQFIEILDGFSVTDSRPDWSFTETLNRTRADARIQPGPLLDKTSTHYGFLSRTLTKVMLNQLCFGNKIDSLLNFEAATADLIEFVDKHKNNAKVDIIAGEAKEGDVVPIEELGTKSDSNGTDPTPPASNDSKSTDLPSTVEVDTTSSSSTNTSDATVSASTSSSDSDPDASSSSAADDSTKSSTPRTIVHIPIANNAEVPLVNATLVAEVEKAEEAEQVEAVKEGVADNIEEKKHLLNATEEITSVSIPGVNVTTETQTALQQEEKKLEKELETTGTIAPSPSSATPAASVSFANEIGKMKLARLRSAEQSIRSLPFQTNFFRVTGNITDEHNEFCRTHGEFKVELNLENVDADGKLAPYSVHTVRVTRIRSDKDPYVCQGDAIHLWLRRIPDYINLDDRTHPMDAPLKTMGINVKTGRREMVELKRLDMFPLSLEQSLQDHYSKMIYGHLFNADLRTVKEDETEYFPVELETVIDNNEAGDFISEQHIGTFAVGAAGEYRLDVLWMGTLYSDSADPYEALHRQSTCWLQPPLAQPLPAKALKSAGKRYPAFSSPVRFAVANGTGPLFVDPEKKSKTTCRGGNQYGTFRGTQFQPFDCHLVNYDVESVSSQIALHGFGYAEIREAPLQITDQTCDVIKTLRAAIEANLPTTDGMIWILFVGDSVMRGMFHDVLDILTNSENPRFHLRDDMPNVFQPINTPFRLEFVRWYASQGTQMPLRNVYDGAPKHDQSWRPYPIPAETRAPDVVFFGSSSWDMSLNSLMDYGKKLTEALQGVKKWHDDRKALIEATAASNPDTSPLNLPRFIWLRPSAEFQFLRIGELSRRNHEQNISSRAASECPANSWTRSHLTTHIGSRLVESLLPFAEQMDLFTLTNQRADQSTNQHFDKLWSAPAGYISRTGAKVLMNMVCQGATKSESDKESESLRESVRELILQDKAIVQEIAEEKQIAPEVIEAGTGKVVVNATADAIEAKQLDPLQAKGTTVTDKRSGKRQFKLPEILTNYNRTVPVPALSEIPRGSDLLASVLANQSIESSYLDIPFTKSLHGVTMRIDPWMSVHATPEPFCRDGNSANWFNEYMDICTKALSKLIDDEETAARKESTEDVPLSEDQQFLVYECVSDTCNTSEGIATHLLEVVYAFFLSIATQRVLIVDWPESLYHVTFSTFNLKQYETFVHRLDRTPIDQKVVFQLQHGDLYQTVLEEGVPGEESAPIPLSSVDFRQQWQSTPFVIMRSPSSVGFHGVTSLFDNVYLRPAFENTGFIPDTIWPCLLNLLFRPTTPILRGLHPYLPFLLDPSSFVVGVQGKFNEKQATSAAPTDSSASGVTSVQKELAASHVVDWAHMSLIDRSRLFQMRFGDTFSTLVSPFECAREVYDGFKHGVISDGFGLFHAKPKDANDTTTVSHHATISVPAKDKPLRFYFISNSRLARNKVVSLFPDSALVLNLTVAGEVGADVSALPQMTIENADELEKWQSEERRQLAASTWMEFWSFPLTDHQVVYTMDTGGVFGKLAALRGFTRERYNEHRFLPHIFDGSKKFHSTCSGATDGITMTELQTDEEAERKLRSKKKN